MKIVWEKFHWYFHCWQFKAQNKSTYIIFHKCCRHTIPPQPISKEMLRWENLFAFTKGKLHQKWMKENAEMAFKKDLHTFSPATRFPAVKDAFTVMSWIMHEGLCFYIFHAKACGIMNQEPGARSGKGKATVDEFFNKTDNYFCLGLERSLLFPAAWCTTLKLQGVKVERRRQSKYVES